MLRVLSILFIMFCAVANACDQPNEEVRGITIGCPIDVNKGFEKIDSDSDGRTANYSYDMVDGLVTEVSVTTLDNNIEYVIFHLQGRVEEDYGHLLTAMEKKWGTSEKLVRSQAVDGNYFGRLPGILEYIQLTAYDGLAFDIHYQSKKIADYWKEKDTKENFDGF